LAGVAGGAPPGAARCFFYDQNNHGVVGLVATFGSDEFNDHHFHYGYFLYAAALVAMDDPNLVSEMAPVMTLLSSDIARPVASDRFPALRVYDAYASHSWASGTSPFADANNQESTSEAVAAWVGLRRGPARNGRRGAVRDRVRAAAVVGDREGR